MPLLGTKTVYRWKWGKWGQRSTSWPSTIGMGEFIEWWRMKLGHTTGHHRPSDRLWYGRQQTSLLPRNSKQDHQWGKWWLVFWNWGGLLIDYLRTKILGLQKCPSVIQNSYFDTLMRFHPMIKEKAEENSLKKFSSSMTTPCRPRLLYQHGSSLIFISGSFRLPRL